VYDFAIAIEPQERSDGARRFVVIKSNMIFTAYNNAILFVFPGIII